MLKLNKEFSVSFEIKPTSYVKGWASVIHLTVGQNHGQYGDRNPAAWFHEDGSGKLVIASGINGNVNSYFVTKSPLPLNEWSKIDIYQVLRNSAYIYEIKLNGEVIYSVQNNDARDFRNVKVYVADPWYDAQPGSIKNLVVANGP